MTKGVNMDWNYTLKTEWKKIVFKEQMKLLF